MSILENIVHLSYCSHTQAPIKQSELDLILEASKRNNKRDDITGLLTYSGEVFVQFLEGPHDAVHQLMNRLKVDPRHKDIIVLSEGSDHERILSGWDMELVTQKEAYQVLQNALGDVETYEKIIGLSSLLAKLAPNIHRAT